MLRQKLKSGVLLTREGSAVNIKVTKLLNDFTKRTNQSLLNTINKRICGEIGTLIMRSAAATSKYVKHLNELFGDLLTMHPEATMGVSLEYND